MPFHKLLIFYLCITIFCTTSAQNFEAGYIILNSNDTVKGLIRNDGWERSPQTILFRAEGQSDVLSYNPATIKAFFIGDILYYSFDADINTKSRSLKDLGYDTSMYFIHDTVFMKALVRSANGLSLYSYTDAYATERFFVRQDDSINELLLNIFKIYILYNDIKVTRSIYLTQLGNYTRDCNSARKPEKIEYEESDLTNYILEYNKCMKYDTDYIAEKETTYFKPGIFVGFSTSHFTTANIEGLTISNADFIASNDLTAGISGNIFFPKSSRYWSMYTAFFYNSLKVNSIVDEPGPGYTIHHEYTFSLQYLKLITAIQYQYNFNSLAPFIYAGFSHAYRLKVEQLHTSQAFYSTGSPGEIHYDTPYNDIYKYEIGYALGIGVLCFDHFAMNIFYNRNYCLSKGGRHFDISSYNVTAAYVF